MFQGQQSIIELSALNHVQFREILQFYVRLDGIREIYELCSYHNIKIIHINCYDDSTTGEPTIIKTILGNLAVI